MPGQYHIHSGEGRRHGKKVTLGTLPCHRKNGGLSFNTPYSLQDYLLRYFYMLFSVQGLGLQVGSLSYTAACMHH